MARGGEKKWCRGKKMKTETEGKRGNEKKGKKGKEKEEKEKREDDFFV